MHAEIISIGDELASGQRLDTNSQWLSQRLGDLGIKTHYHVTVLDDLEANISVFQLAAERSPLVISTGGLGPTADDLTRQAIAEAFGRPLEFDAESFEHILQLFSQRKRPMPERNRVQAMFPQGCKVIPNPQGSAPGIDLFLNGTGEGKSASRIFALPGVPAEMKEMWEQSVEPRLKADLGAGRKKLFFRSLKLFGIGESDVEAKLPDLIQRDRYPRVGITVHRATITLRIATEAEDEWDSERQIVATETTIRESFGDLVFGAGDTCELEHAVLDALRVRAEKVAIVEFGAGAFAGPWLMSCDGPVSQFVSGAINFPSFDRFREWTQGKLGVADEGQDAELSSDGMRPLKSPDFESALRGLLESVLPKVAAEFDADWILVAGPYPYLSADTQSDTRKEPSRTDPFWVSVGNRERVVRCKSWEPTGHRDVVLCRMAKIALDQLRRTLLGISE